MELTSFAPGLGVQLLIQRRHRDARTGEEGSCFIQPRVGNLLAYRCTSFRAGCRTQSNFVYQNPHRRKSTKRKKERQRDRERGGGVGGEKDKEKKRDREGEVSLSFSISPLPLSAFLPLSHFNMPTVSQMETLAESSSRPWHAKSTSERRRRRTPND